MWDTARYCQVLCVGYCKMLPVHVGYCKILPGTVGYCKILTGTVGYCKMLPGTVRYCKMLPGTVWYCKMLPGTVWYCKMLPVNVGYCKILPGTVGYCKMLPGTVGYCKIVREWQIFYSSLDIQKQLNYPSHLFIDYCVTLYFTWNQSKFKVLVSNKHVKRTEDILFFFEPETIQIYKN